MKNILSLLIIVLISNSAIAGGPWVKKKGESYFQFGGGIIPSTNQLFYKGNELLFINRKITDVSLGFYNEYGITNKLTLITDLPFKFVNSDANNDTTLFLPVLNSGSLSGFGNISFTPKYELLSGNIKLAGAIKFSLPTGKYDKTTGLRTAYETFGIMPIIDIGFSKNKLYTFIETGYNFRTALADDFKFEFEIGYKFYKNIYAILNFNSRLSTFKPNVLTTENDQTGLYANGQEYSALTLKISTPIKNNVGVNFHLTLINFHGHLVQRSPSIGGSIYYKLKK